MGGSVQAEGGRRRELHGELGGGGGHGARRLLWRARRARPGSRRSGAGTERSEAAWGARNRSGWRGKAGATPVAALCSARTGGGRERKEEEEKAPGEERIRSCAKVKAERGMEGEDRRRGDAWSLRRWVAAWVAYGHNRAQ